jgi:putative oxidoreductase
MSGHTGQTLTDVPIRPLIPALAPLERGLAVLGYPLMRFTTGVFLMPHGAQKLFGAFGGNPAATAQFFDHIGLQPGSVFTTIAGCAEFFGGLLLALGLLTRFAAVVVGVLMLVAIFTVHLPNGWFWTKMGIEYPLFWGLMAAGCACRGGGRFSLDAAIGREL